MFIPLNSTDDNDWPNILLAGDTASVFYLLGLLSPYKLNVFVADTGVEGRSPLQFKSGRCARRDIAGAYYDFFEQPCRIGAGVLRRFDLLIHTTIDGYIQGWARLLRIPSVQARFSDAGKATLELEGAVPGSGCISGCRDRDSALAEVLLACTDAAAYGRYRNVSAALSAEDQGSIRVSPPAPLKLPPMVVPEEIKYSAWDYIGDLISATGTTMLYAEGEAAVAMSAIAGSDRLIELGVPELHILRCGRQGDRYIELTGDLGRVFDELM
jgi:hypothetical protein